MPQGQRIDQLYYDIGANLGPLNKGIAGATVGIKKLGKAIKTPIGAFVALGAAAALAGARATRMAAELDKALREVGTLLPGTVEGLRDLRSEVIALSTEVPAPPVQLTKGLYQVISAGVTDTADAIHVLEIATKAATAGLAESDQAVRAITTVLNAYGLEARQAERVSDAFFVAIAQGVTRFPELASSIGNVATSAAQAGLEVEEMTAAIATLTKAGLSTDEAATALNRLLFSLIQNTEEAQEAARDMGAEFTLAALQSKGLVGFLRDLRDATDGEIAALAEINPSIRSLRALLPLVGDQFDELEGTLRDTRDGVGATERAFDEMRGALENQEQLLKNRLNQAWLAFGNALLPARQALTGFALSLLGINDELERMRLNQLNLGALTDNQLTASIDGFAASIERARQKLAEIDGQSHRSRALRANIEAEIQSYELQLAALEKVAERRAMLNSQEAQDAQFRAAMRARADEARTSLEELADALEEAGEQIIEGGEQARAYTDAIWQMSNGLREMADAADEAAARHERLNRALGDEAAANATKDVEQLINAWASGERSIESNVRTYQAIIRRLQQAGMTVDDLIPALRKYIAIMQNGLDPADDFGESLGDLAANALRAARSLVSAARAMGAFGDSAAASVNDVSNIVEGIIGATAAGAGVGGVVAGIAQAVAGLAGFGSAVFGGTEESPEAKYAREVQERNTEALQNLEAAVVRLAEGFLDLPTAGVQQAIQDAIAAAWTELEEEFGPNLGGKGYLVPGVAMTHLNEALLALGLTMEDLIRVAEALGITWDESAAGALNQLRQALEELDLSQVFETFTGKLALLRREFELFDLDPIDRVRKLLAVLGSATDLEIPIPVWSVGANDPGSVAAANEWLQQLFRAFSDDPNAFAGLLGGLQPNEVLDLLSQIESLLDQVGAGLAEGAEEGVTRGFQVSRTITEVTGNRLAGLMSTIAFHAEQTALNTAGILDSIMGDVAMPPLAPPSTTDMANFTATPGGGGMVVHASVVTGDILVSGADDPLQVARTISARLSDQVDAALADHLLNQRRSYGLRQTDTLRTN